MAASSTAALSAPIASHTARELVQVIRDLVGVRPVNWQDSNDPQQRAAWQAADTMLAKMGVGTS